MTPPPRGPAPKPARPRAPGPRRARARKAARRPKTLGARLRGEAAVFLLALQFLTRLPLPARGYSAARMSATPRWLPAVGALIGGLVALAWLAAAAVFPPVLAVLLATAFGLLLTGCLHEDGFADACDGLGGGATRARALEIMRDSRLGTYGAAGLGMMLAAKVAALIALPGALIPLALVAGHAASRASAVAVIASSAYVRDHGTGKPVATGLSRRSLAFALACGVAPLLFLPPLAALGGFAGLILGHLAMRSAWQRKLGGYTGDCLGAVQQVSEVGFTLGLLACL
jgi:adenosylcobinamide-GDP ribazoletransferase